MKFSILALVALATFTTPSAHAIRLGDVDFYWTFTPDTAPIPKDFKKMISPGFTKDSASIEIFFHTQTNQPNQYHFSIGSPYSPEAEASAPGAPTNAKENISCSGSFTLRATTPEQVKALVELTEGAKIKLPKIAAHFAAVRANEDPFHMIVQDPWLRPIKIKKKIISYQIIYDFMVTIEKDADYGDLHLELNTTSGKAVCQTKLNYLSHHTIVNNPKEGAAAEVATDVIAHAGMR